MTKTLARAWGAHEPGTVLTDDRAEVAKDPKAVLVHASRMANLEEGGYFVAPAKPQGTAPPPPAGPALGPTRLAPSTDKVTPTEGA